jgi:predicted Holliday junction resolvase-like endonuclease
MSVLDELRRRKGLFAVCPNCEESFSLHRARLFDALGTLPDHASQYFEAAREELAEQRRDLKARAQQAATHPQVVAEAVRVGKVVEKIARSLPGFPLQPRDCRPLFEPIDYVVFNGHSARGEIDSVWFVDVKSGKGRLDQVQQDIRRLATGNKVTLTIIDDVAEKSS